MLIETNKNGVTIVLKVMSESKNGFEKIIPVAYKYNDKYYNVSDELKQQGIIDTMSYVDFSKMLYKAIDNLESDTKQFKKEVIEDLRGCQISIENEVRAMIRSGANQVKYELEYIVSDEFKIRNLYEQYMSEVKSILDCAKSIFNDNQEQRKLYLREMKREKMITLMDNLMTYPPADYETGQKIVMLKRIHKTKKLKALVQIADKQIELELPNENEYYDNIYSWHVFSLNDKLAAEKILGESHFYFGHSNIIQLTADDEEIYNIGNVSRFNPEDVEIVGRTGDKSIKVRVAKLKKYVDNEYPDHIRTSDEYTLFYSKQSKRYLTLSFKTDNWIEPVISLYPEEIRILMEKFKSLQ